MSAMNNITNDQLVTTAAFIKKLAGLGLKAEMTKIEPGPVVTSYHFKPHNSIPLAKFMNKDEDFAIAAGVEKVTLQRVLGEIVIFAANKERRHVDYKDYLNWFLTDSSVGRMAIPISLGVNYLGNNSAIDLVEQPHILLAGSTGSGKSVLESAIICSLVVFKRPQELEMILVDTKQLDLPLFSELPHVKQVVTKLEEYLAMMEALILECRNRMANLQGASCRNIKEYHKLGFPMPYKVLIIDEFADLLEQDREAKREKYSIANDYPKADEQLKRLVQISRAAGIHIIAGTQRTSVKIVSGDIKANFPCRISLQLPTGFDSRTILGQDGAETLLGKGDMLVALPQTEALQRFHGPYVQSGDIARIVTEHENIRDMYERIRSNQ